MVSKAKLALQVPEDLQEAQENVDPQGQMGEQDSLVNKEIQDPLVVLVRQDPEEKLDVMALMVILENLDLMERVVHLVHQVPQDHLVWLVMWVIKEMWEKKDLKEVKETLEFLVKGDHLVLLGPLVMMVNLENLDWLVAQESLGDKDQLVREEMRGPLDHKDARV